MKHPYTKILALFGLLLVLGACGEDEAADAPEPTIDFNGYTGKDTKNVITSPVDPTDWTQDATWTSKEQGLFSKYNFVFGKPQLAATAWRAYDYPNPAPRATRNQFGLTVNKTDPTLANANVRMAFSLVNAKYEQLYSGDGDAVDRSFGVYLPFDNAKYSDNTLYRVYYVVYDKLTLQVYYQGHGDIKVVP